MRASTKDYLPPPKYEIRVPPGVTIEINGHTIDLVAIRRVIDGHPHPLTPAEGAYLCSLLPKIGTHTYPDENDLLNLIATGLGMTQRQFQSWRIYRRTQRGQDNLLGPVKT
jgi:hypothetical protein